MIANVHFVGARSKLKLAVHVCDEQLLVTICAATEGPDVVIGVTVTEAGFVPVVTVKA